MNERRMATENTMKPNGEYWGCWVVCNLNSGKVAVSTTRTALQKATMSCSMAGDLYHVEAILFDGDLPTARTIHLAIIHIQRTYLNDDKISYFNWLKATAHEHLYEPKRDPTRVSLAERLAEILELEKKEGQND